MSIESTQHHLDGQVLYWEEVKRRVGSAIEFCRKAQLEYSTSPHASKQAILSSIWLGQAGLETELAHAVRMLESCIQLADPAVEIIETVVKS